MSSTITIRIDPKTKERLEKLAQATDRSISYFVSHALEQVIEQVEWQIGEIKRRVELADKPGAKFIPHEHIEAWLQSWGTKRGPGMTAGSLKGIMKPLEGLKESKSTPQKKPAATSAAIKPSSMAEFDKLIAKARIQGKKAGLKQSDLTAAVDKARSRR